jgi:hypothetical protein
MNSFDLFDTLVAGRDINTPCGDQPEGNHFVIAETLSKVQPDDLIISDYYDPEKAQRIVTNVLGLKNKLIVGNGIKASGEVFRFHPKPVHHTDDKEYAVNSAKREGIQASLVQLSPMTKIEKEIYDAGMQGLALLMREARLTTYAKPNKFQDRQLQLMQIQANFPMLFCASVLIHRKMVAEKRDRLLMCSRDACMWQHLQKAIRDLHHAEPLWWGALGGKNSGQHMVIPYDVRYFLNSRLTRYKPSDDYMEYAKQMITPSTLILDLCGSGWSLRHFQEHFEQKPDCMVLIGYENMGVNPHAQNSTMAPGMPYMFPWMGSDTPEMANFAKHPMIEDVVDGKPRYSNVKGVDWENHPQIAVMHEGFNACLDINNESYYSLTKDINVSDETLKKVFKLCQRRVEDSRPLLRMFCDEWFYAEEKNTRGEIVGRQPLMPPKSVRPRPGMAVRSTL